MTASAVPLLGARSLIDEVCGQVSGNEGKLKAASHEAEIEQQEAAMAEGLADCLGQV